MRTATTPRTHLPRCSVQSETASQTMSSRSAAVAVGRNYVVEFPLLAPKMPNDWEPSARLSKAISELVLLFALNEGVTPAFQNAGHLIPNHRNVN